MKKLTFTLRAVKITALFVLVFLSGMVLAQEKITICHCPPGNPNNCHSITISVNAWAAHLENHSGDHLGVCDGDDAYRKLVDVVVSPNPATDQTTINYDLSEESSVNIDVYNEMGYKVQTILSDTKQAGTYTEDFSAQASGFYLVNVVAVTPYEAVQTSQTIIQVK
jgi:hypothetical protein